MVFIGLRLLGVVGLGRGYRVFGMNTHVYFITDGRDVKARISSASAWFSRRRSRRGVVIVAWDGVVIVFLAVVCVESCVLAAIDIWVSFLS